MKPSGQFASVRPTPQVPRRFASRGILLIIAAFFALGVVCSATSGLALAQGPPEWVADKHPLGFSLSADKVKESSAHEEASETVLPDELLVKFRRGVGRQMRQAALERVAFQVHHFQDRNFGIRGRRGLPIFDQLVRIKLKPGMTPEEAIANLARDPNVEFSEPNLVVQALESFPSDRDFDLLWGLYNIGQTGGSSGADIGAPAAWDISIGSPQIVVAVIDTGIEYSHPDLAPNIWVNADEIPGNGIDDDGNSFVDDVYGYDFYNDDADPKDDHFHGTHCAGIIGATGDNGIGIAGVNWAVQLMAVKFLSASGSGATGGAVSAIQYAINNGASVMSNSWGGAGFSQVLQDVILEAHNAGIVFVAAAGNSGNDSLVYPAAYDKVIAVSATDHNDVKASFSSYGTFIDVAAPGVNIFSTKLNGDYGYASGTSMACPHVSGLAALLKSHNSTITPDQVEHILETTAEDLGEPGWDAFYGSGRINALRAMLAVTQEETSFATASISSPTGGQFVSGETLDILGTAGGSEFADYTVEYAGAEDDTWNLITSATTPVQDGLLASWDTSILPDGNYILLLTVTDTLNRKIYDAVSVTLDNYEAVITFPTQLVSLGKVDILGSASATNDMPFGSYIVEWGMGTIPTSFSTAGITLANNGLQPVTNGKLATWDTSGLIDGQNYTLRLTVQASLERQSQTSMTTKVDADLVVGWPVVLSANSSAYVVPTVADLDGDGIKELVVAGPDEQIRAYRKDASPFPGFPVALNEGDYFRWAVNVDDLDGDGTQEIVAVVSNQSSNPPCRILVLNHDGTAYQGWPTPGLIWPLISSDLTPAIADLNGDGTKELITIAVFTWVDRTEVALHAFGLNGIELAGFPKLLILPPLGFDPDQLTPSKHGVPSIADLDGDGHPEIAWSYSNRVYVFDHEGIVLPGWPFIAPSYNGKTMLFENAAASGDIDGDGQLELFSIGRGYNCGGCETQLYGWRKDGSVLPGWPKSDEIDGVILWNTTSNQNTPVLADIDGDGKDEVVVGLNELAVFDDVGPVPFPADPILSLTQPSPSDVDGDGRLEFSGNWYDSIGIADNDGSYYWSRIMPSGGTRNTLGMFADLEGDSTMELVLAHADSARCLALYLWEIPRPGPSSAAEEWCMFNYDPARSGRRGLTDIDPTPDSSPPASTIDFPAGGSTVSGVVTVEMSATDNVFVSGVELYLDGTVLGMDTAEPFSLTWDTIGVPNGNHTLLAKAYDAAGNIGASPPVTVTVSNDVTPPNTPTLVAPTNGITTADPTPTFDWTDVSDPSGVHYRLQVDNSADFSSPEIGLDGLESSTYTSGQPLGDGTYSWRVLAVDGAGRASPWSEVRTLIITTCIPEVPTVTVSPASQNATAGTTLEYAVSVTNTDSADCAASTFSLGRIIPSGWTGAVTPSSLSVLPGQTAQATLSVTSADDSAPGNYGLNVVFSDALRSTHNASAEALYEVLVSQDDVEPPTASAGLSASLKLKHVNLSWTSATDNVGVAGYRLFRDGILIIDTTGTSHVDRAVSPGGTFTYHVVAYDAAGNHSAPSNSVTVTFPVDRPGKNKPN